jgi:hypothetical protein
MTEQKKPKSCDLCGGKEGRIELYAGGYVGHAHERCTEIGNQAIELFFKLIAFHPNGTNILAEQLLKARGAKFDLNDLFKEAKAPQEKSAPIDELLWPDRKVFLDMKNSLLADMRYAGKYVAVLDGKLIDSDDDRVRLAKRVYDKYGYRQIYMSKVEREERIYRMEAASYIDNLTSKEEKP